MRIFEFLCDDCGAQLEVPSPETIPIGALRPCACGKSLRRVVSLPHVPPDSLSVNADYVPEKYRVASNDGFGIGEAGARARERKYQKAHEAKRAMAREANPGRHGMKMTHSIPSDLYHGKIRETGDKHYWDDKKNLNRHDSTKL